MGTVPITVSTLDTWDHHQSRRNTMGSSTSKVSRGTARQYPKQPTSAVSVPRVGARPSPHNLHKQASGADSSATRPDGGDPDIVTGEFSQRCNRWALCNRIRPSHTHRQLRLTPRPS